MADLSLIEPIARGLLDKRGSPLAALPDMRKLLLKRVDLLDALALAYLETLSGVTIDTDTSSVKPTARKAKATKATKPIAVRAHRRTAADRAVAIDAMAKNLSSVFGRPVLGRADEEAAA